MPCRALSLMLAQAAAQGGSYACVRMPHGRAASCLCAPRINLRLVPSADDAASTHPSACGWRHWRRLRRTRCGDDA